MADHDEQHEKATPDFTDKQANPPATPQQHPADAHRMQDDAAHPADEMVPPPTESEKEQRLERARVSRRMFLMNIGIAMNAVVAAAIAVPVVAYLLGPARTKYLSWVDLGDASQFPVGETSLVTFLNPYRNSWDGETAKLPAYVRVSAPGDYTVFAINCAHLGCPVRWFSESQLFMCPCHGGVYYADGSRASGPPERGLFKYPIKVQNGHLMIDAGQMPTLSTQASLKKPCPPAGATSSQPALVTRIAPCPGTNEPTIG